MYYNIIMSCTPTGSQLPAACSWQASSPGRFRAANAHAASGAAVALPDTLAQILEDSGTQWSEWSFSLHRSPGICPNNGESNGKETVWKPGLDTMSTTIISSGINAIVPTSILTIALQRKPRSQLACRGRAIFLAGPPPCWRVVLV